MTALQSFVSPRGNMSGMKLKLDLHEVYNRGGEIDRALRAVIDEAMAKRAPLVEIIPGKGSGALKKHVLRFLDRKPPARRPYLQSARQRREQPQQPTARVAANERSLRASSTRNVTSIKVISTPEAPAAEKRPATSSTSTAASRATSQKANADLISRPLDLIRVRVDPR
jgi:Smr domain-containing protein